MKKYLIKFGLVGTLTFLVFFVYFYKNSGKFRQSIIAAFAALPVIFSSQQAAHSAGQADAFPQQSQQHQSPPQNKGIFSRKSYNDDPGSGKPNGDDSDGDDGGIPKYPKTTSIEETQKHLSYIDEQIHKLEELTDSDSETKEDECRRESKAEFEELPDIDFQYEYDSNGNPTLLVPNPGKARTKRNYIRVEFEQTASHMHHAPDLNIPLPSDFDMSHYMNLDKAGRIDYAKQKLSRETIINYQNEIGKSMSPLFDPKKTLSVPGFGGKYKQNTELTIQQKAPDNTILSIIREDGVHITSYSIDDRALRQLTKDNFWVLKDRNF